MVDGALPFFLCPLPFGFSSCPLERAGRPVAGLPASAGSESSPHPAESSPCPSRVCSRTAIASLRRRVPAHKRHGCSDMYWTMRVLTHSLSVLSKLRWRLGITPSNHVPVPMSPFLSVPHIRTSRTFFGTSLYGRV